MIYDGKRIDERYIFDRGGNPYLALGIEYLYYLQDYEADEYDVLVAQTHVNNCGRVICYPRKNWHGYYEPVDNEYLLNDLYDQVILLD